MFVEQELKPSNFQKDLIKLVKWYRQILQIVARHWFNKTLKRTYDEFVYFSLCFLTVFVDCRGSGAIL